MGSLNCSDAMTLQSRKSRLDHDLPSASPLTSSVTEPTVRPELMSVVFDAGTRTASKIGVLKPPWKRSTCRSPRKMTKLYVPQPCVSPLRPVCGKRLEAQLRALHDRQRWDPPPWTETFLQNRAGPRRHHAQAGEPQQSSGDAATKPPHKDLQDIHLIARSGTRPKQRRHAPNARLTTRQLRTTLSTQEKDEHLPECIEAPRDRSKERAVSRAPRISPHLVRAGRRVPPLPASAQRLPWLEVV